MASVAIVYHSGYGHTKAVAEAVMIPWWFGGVV